MSQMNDPYGAIGSSGGLAELLRRSGQTDPSAVADFAARHGGSVHGNQLVTGDGVPPNQWSSLTGGPAPKNYTDLGTAMGGGGLLNQLSGAIVGPGGDLQRDIAAERGNRADVLGARGSLNSFNERVGAGVTNGLPAYEQALKGIGGQADQYGNEAVAGTQRLGSDVLSHLDASLQDVHAQGQGAVAHADLAEHRMLAGIDEFRKRSLSDQAAAVSGLRHDQQAYESQVQGNPDLDAAQKAQLVQQNRQNSTMPNVANTLAGMQTSFSDNLAQLNTSLSGLTAQGAGLREGVAGLDQQGALGRAGVATGLGGLTLESQRTREALLNAKENAVAMAAHLHSAGQLAAMQLEMQGKTNLAEFIRGTPESPVSYASAISAMLAARTIPGVQGFGPIGPSGASFA